MPAKVVVTAEPGPLYHVAEVTVLGPERQPLDHSARPQKGERKDPGTAAASRRTGPHRAGRRDRDGAARARSDMPATRSRKSSTGGSSSTMKRARWRSPMCSTPDRRCASARRRSAVSNGSTRPMSSGASGGARARSTTSARSRRRGGRWSIPGCSAPSRSSRCSDPADPDQVAMRVEAVERAHRTIGVGAAYNTSEGVVRAALLGEPQPVRSGRIPARCDRGRNAEAGHRRHVPPPRFSCDRPGSGGAGRGRAGEPGRV